MPDSSVWSAKSATTPGKKLKSCLKKLASALSILKNQSKPMPANKIILGFAGDLASGKGTVCKYLEQKYGTPSYRFSTILRALVDRLYIPQSRENLQKISQVLRENFSQDILSKVIASDVQADNNAIVIVNGIRRASDIVYLRELPN